MLHSKLKLQEIPIPDAGCRKSLERQSGEVGGSPVCVEAVFV